jgi:hypothetical protein
MPSFAGATRDRSLALDARDCAYLESPGQGLGVAPAGAGDERAVWWVLLDERYSGVRLDAAVIDGCVGDVVVVELWAQEHEIAGGVLLGSWTWTVDAMKPSRSQVVAVVAGCPSRGWGVRARMASAHKRRVALSLICDPGLCGSGVLWKGEGVT